MKYEKVVAEINRIRGKIGTYQTRLRELERLKTEMENTEIVSLVRGLNLAPEELRAFVETHIRQNNGLPQEPPLISPHNDDPLNDYSLDEQGNEGQEGDYHL